MRTSVKATVLLATLGTGCAASTGVHDVRQLAGSWRGRVSNVLGHAPAVLTIAEDGTYTGTMYLDDRERRFAGAIVVIDGRRARYMGSDGSGSVRLERAARTLRFVQDGGGGGASFTPSP
jgi:hypothetical protein